MTACGILSMNSGGVLVAGTFSREKFRLCATRDSMKKDPGCLRASSKVLRGASESGEKKQKSAVTFSSLSPSAPIHIHLRYFGIRKKCHWQVRTIINIPSRAFMYVH